MEKLLLIGASGLAREVLAVTRSTEDQAVVGILDDGWADIGDHFDDVPVLGAIDRAIEYVDTKLLVCVGAGQTRERIVARLAELGISAEDYTSVVDPTVRNPAGCAVGRGSILLANVALTTAVTIGHHVVIMPNVTLTHDDVIGDFVTIAAGVALGGGVHVGQGAYLGMNASVRQQVTVGANATLGMGAVLLGPLPDEETWAGVPARPLPIFQQDATSAPPASGSSPTSGRSS